MAHAGSVDAEGSLVRGLGDIKAALAACDRVALQAGQEKLKLTMIEDVSRQHRVKRGKER
jgi:hypothetical protein